MTLGLGAYPFQTDPKAGLGPTKSIPEENGVVNKGTASEPNDEPYKDTHRYSCMHSKLLLFVFLFPIRLFLLSTPLNCRTVVIISILTVSLAL